MNTLRFVHQQVFQLKWQVLASIGLIMVLPLEEAVVSLYEGDGFYSSGLTMVSIWLTPLLAALIACASVQADLDERREALWRSKPVNIHLFVTGKFFIGLLLSLGILICPILFTWITMTANGDNVRGESLQGKHFFIFSVIFVSLLTYSMCFFCNILMRKTARAWLIGITIACFALLIPFILPINVKDVTVDLIIHKWVQRSYLAVTLGLTILAFIGSLLAVQHNWRIHTHLRGLLWGGAGLIFVVFLLFSRQIANIKILDETSIPMKDSQFFIKTEDKIILDDRYGNSNIYDVITTNDAIRLNELPSKVIREEIEKARPSTPQFESPKDLERGIYPYSFMPKLKFQRGSQWYLLNIFMYYRSEEVADRFGDIKKETKFEKLYLRCFRVMEGYTAPVASLDLSDYLYNNHHPDPSVLFTEDKAVVLLRAYILVIDIAEPNVMKVIESLPIKRVFRAGPEEQIDLLPITSLDMKDRIKLSVDLRKRIQYGNDQFYYVPTENQDGRYVCISDKGMRCYDITNWDEDTIHGRLRDERPFTILETIFGDRGWNNRYFVQEGKLYNCSENTLMVFDVAGPRIRKLGHFERISDDYHIEDINVLENGNILLMSSYRVRQSEKYQVGLLLQLLKNPQ